MNRLILKNTLVMLSILSLCYTASDAEDRYTIHEWGTFTVLQDESGNALPGVNVNEEPLPEFVHRLLPGLVNESGEVASFQGASAAKRIALLSKQLSAELQPLANRRSKGLPVSFTAARMRMETPIIYVYPPRPETISGESKKAELEPLDISVQFRGGWISEWYPNADVKAPGFDPSRINLGSLQQSTVGKINWRNLTMDADSSPPSTDSHVWLAPRKVASSRLRTAKGETEQYLFYRGVANISSPFSVRRDQKTDQLRVWAVNNALIDDKIIDVPAAWLADIRPDGSVAFRDIRLTQPAHPPQSRLLATTEGSFEQSQFSVDNLPKLRESMRIALVEAGLFEDEAEAMLNTWELSYFKSAGTRLFFLLPQAWTEQVIPLNASQPADITRVMIGRVEIKTPQHEQTLDQLAKVANVSSHRWLGDQLKSLSDSQRNEFWQHMMTGKKSLSDYGIEVPDDYRLFLDLGRFREALVLDRLRRNPTESLRQFVSKYNISFSAKAALN